ncbi:MAG: Lysis protein [Roseibaca calidilacus]|uniref:Lysis protein n=1 Tax=Roseibaca calidilacus TaxID=1666912 RepID=A0A0P7WU74_9RHOB|nr:MAG: Lysis protein [Roseibaca calidilacus]
MRKPLAGLLVAVILSGCSGGGVRAPDEGSSVGRLIGRVIPFTGGIASRGSGAAGNLCGVAGLQGQTIAPISSSTNGCGVAAPRAGHACRRNQPLTTGNAGLRNRDGTASLGHTGHAPRAEA